MISVTSGPNDAFLIDRRFVLRIDRYDEHALVMSLSTVVGRHLRTFGVLRGERVDVVDHLRLQFDGIFHNSKCEPADSALIILEGEESTKVWYHMFAGVPVVDDDPL